MWDCRAKNRPKAHDWIADCGAHVGGTVFLDMPEMGVEGLADVIAIEPAPEVESLPEGCDPSEYGLVTGTFKHTSGEVYDLKLASESKPIGVTGSHPFWSVDRETWVSVLDLEIGETLKTLEGTTIVESRVRRPGSESVYNIEVEEDHVYRVGESGVLVHNASFKDCDPCEGASTTTESVGGYSVKFSKTTYRNKNRACRIWQIEGPLAVTASNPVEAESARNSMRSFFFKAADPLPAQTEVGATHEAGHLVADSLGGPNDYRNLVPMAAKLNKSPGAWRDMELFITRCLREAGSSAGGNIQISLKYADGRPFHRYVPTTLEGSFRVSSSSGTKLHTFSFKNKGTESSKDFGQCFS